MPSKPYCHFPSFPALPFALSRQPLSGPLLSHHPAPKVVLQPSSPLPKLPSFRHPDNLTTHLGTRQAHQSDLPSGELVAPCPHLLPPCCQSPSLSSGPSIKTGLDVDHDPLICRQRLLPFPLPSREAEQVDRSSTFVLSPASLPHSSHTITHPRAHTSTSCLGSPQRSRDSHTRSLPCICAEPSPSRHPRSFVSCPLRPRHCHSAGHC